MKKTRKTIPLTQRVLQKLLRRPQTLKGFEVTVTSETDSSKGDIRGNRPRGLNAESLSPPLRKRKGSR